MDKLKKKYTEYQEEFDHLSTKYEGSVKEKMLMKLEKDRLFAKVDSLEANLSQIYKDSKGDDDGLVEASNFKMESSPTRTHQSM
jgi:hypothetical protein